MNQALETRLFSISEAAHQLGVNPWTLRAHAKRGALKTTRIGRRMLVSARELARVEREGLPSLAHYKPNKDAVDQAV